MVRFSQIMVSIMSFIVLISSIFALSFFATVVKKGPLECNTNAPIKILFYGIFLFCLSLLGLMGAIRGNRRLLLIYAGVIFVWFVFVLLSSAFLKVVSKMSDAKAVKDHREYQLNEYPRWLQRHTVDGKKWVTIKRCMVIDKTCKGLIFEKDTSGASIGKSSLMYSCCQPPLQCGFVHTNDTYWEIPKSGNLSEDPDCQIWSNNLEQVCYDCNSCKAGYIRTLKYGWEVDALTHAVGSGFIFIGFWVAFWALRQTPREDHYHHTTDNI